jgi:hypothetical protein
VLAIGLKVYGFKTDRGRWIYKGDKNPLHVFLRRTQPSAPCCKILQRIKEPFEIVRRPNSSPPSPVHSALLLGDCFQECQRALVNESGAFPCRCHSTSVIHGDDQKARWWPQFRDVVSPHRHDHHYHANTLFFPLSFLQNFLSPAVIVHW